MSLTKFRNAATTLIGIVAMLPLAVQAAIVVNPAVTIVEQVTVQPIVVRDDAGLNPSTFFGTATQQANIEAQIDLIWAQAGIDVRFLAPNTLNSTEVQVGTVNPRPLSDLNDHLTLGAAALNPDPLVLNMFLVDIPAGFGAGDIGLNGAAGLAFVGGNGISQFVGSDLLTPPFGQGGLDVIASVVAHEIGHNLGLDHISSPVQNLMNTGGGASMDNGERLISSQIATAIASDFSVPIAAVPLPAAGWFLISGFMAVFATRRLRSRASR